MYTGFSQVNDTNLELGPAQPVNCLVKSLTCGEINSVDKAAEQPGASEFHFPHMDSKYVRPLARKSEKAVNTGGDISSAQSAGEFPRLTYRGVCALVAGVTGTAGAADDAMATRASGQTPGGLTATAVTTRRTRSITTATATGPTRAARAERTRMAEESAGSVHPAVAAVAAEAAVTADDGARPADTTLATERGGGRAGKGARSAEQEGIYAGARFLPAFCVNAAWI